MSKLRGWVTNQITSTRTAIHTLDNKIGDLVSQRQAQQEKLSTLLDVQSIMQSEEPTTGGTA